MTDDPIPTTDEAPDPVPYQKILKAYNDAVAGTPLPAALKITTERKKHLQARWQEPLFRERYADVFRKAVQIPWLRGECPSPGHEDWTGSFDFLIRNDTNYVNVLERPIPKKTVNTKPTAAQLGDAELALAKRAFDAYAARGGIRAMFKWNGTAYYDLATQWMAKGM